MKQSPYVIALLLGAAASVKLTRPESDDLLNIHNTVFDQQNGLYRDMAPQGYRQLKKRNISDENIDENVYEFVNPLVDPVSKNRALEPKVKTQFDTPPTFQTKS
jgi:hypothetical protein